MSQSISISLSPGESKSFSGDPERTFEEARAWLKEQHVKVAEAARAERARAHAEEQAKIAETAKGTKPTTLTPDTVKVKGGKN